MAKDDYYVIAYQILSYLYNSLKKGRDVEEALLRHDSPLFKVKLNERYWQYIIRNLKEEGYIQGFIGQWLDDIYVISHLDKTEITPKGIDYLCENSLMEKAKAFLKEAKEIVPFA